MKAHLWLTLNCIVLLVASERYYSIIAPGVIKSNRNYTVVISLHEAPEPAAVRVSIEGPHYHESQLVFVKPFETVKSVFCPHKLLAGDYKLIAEGVSGIRFRNESKLFAHGEVGPKVYIQTDRAVYKPGGLIQFRVLIMNEHLKPMKIHEPIRVEILDGKMNRVKQFKDIRLVKGVYSGQLELSEYPVLGQWQIRVFLSGKYDFTASKSISIRKYILPKFSVHIETENNFITEDGVVKALVYGKYTFDKYVQGNVTSKLVAPYQDVIIQQQQMYIKDKLLLEFHLENVKGLFYSFELQVEIVERYTGLKEKASAAIRIRDQRYNIYVEQDSIEFANDKPFRLTVNVRYWNNTAVDDRSTPVLMQYGTVMSEVYLNDKGEALFEVHDDGGSVEVDYVFKFKSSTYTMPSYFKQWRAAVDRTDLYCRLQLKGDRPRLGVPVHIEVSSPEYIPYLIYTIVGHANIIRMEHITLPRYEKSYTIEIIPSIEMIPSAYLYVHYIQNGNLRYEELRLNFPKEFENQISIVAPPQVKPGQEITFTVTAQPESMVCLLAVDISVYMLDPSYDLEKAKIMQQLQEDITFISARSKAYPGRVSGLLTFTNAHYEYIPEPLYGGLGSALSRRNINIRSDFPETLSFQCVEISNAISDVTIKMPDTITTWRLTAFSVNEVTGFGLVDGPTDIIATQPFFIQLNLPYSVKLGEIISIPILVHNYHNHSLDTEITMHNTAGEFYFMDSTIFDPERGSEDDQRSKRVKVTAYSIERVSFLVNPKIAGELNLSIAATNPISTDAIVQTLKVEPDGLLQSHNKGLYIDLFSGEMATERFTLPTPMDTETDYEFVTLSVGSDSLGPVLKNLNKLVKLPTGCGEQNMANFAPNILILQYLKASGSFYLERDLVSKVKSFIEIGYQQQLSYRHSSNGGYSVFGQRHEEEPSTWLTAYVIRFFIKASKYVTIERTIIISGLDYLASSQMYDGSFSYTGYLLHSGQHTRFGFTAFVLMTFLEDRILAMKYQRTIEKGLQFLNSSLYQVQDIYDLSIMAMALQMAHNSDVHIILDKLKLKSQQLSHLMWWSNEDGNPQKDVEITAYILMALLDSGNEPGDELRILRWLIEQRNEKGGFKSTHDTVVGLEALVKFTEKYNNFESTNLKIQYSAKSNDGSIVKNGEFRVNFNNKRIWQNEELPKSTRSVDINATGFGHSLLQLTYHYHVVPEETSEHFQIQPETKMLNSMEMFLKICFSYHPSSESSKTDNVYTNMTIMEVNLPSGFTTTDKYRSDLLGNETIIQRLESTNSDSVVVMYFEKLSVNVRYCLTIIADKMHDVIVRKPSAIVIYDYYNTSRRDTVVYTCCGTQPVRGGLLGIR